MKSTSSLTAPADFLNAASSSGVSLIWMISSTARAQLARNADEQVLRAVFPLQVDRARQDLLLVEQDRFDHFHHGRAGRVPGAGADQFRDLEAAAGGARRDPVDRFLAQEIGDRDAGH